MNRSLIFFFLPFLCSLPYTSKLVKTLLYNFIRQEKPPPPGTHVFPQQSDGGGLLYGLASGVASKSTSRLLSVGISSNYPQALLLTGPLPLAVLVGLSMQLANCNQSFRSQWWFMVNVRK